MRILMLGNSLTSSHDLPQKLARRLGAEVVAHTRGGARLAEQLNPNTCMGALTCAAFDAGGWDFVVMQDMSNAAVTTPQRFIDAAVALSARARGAGAVPVIYGTWAYAPWCARLGRLGMTSGAMRDAISEAYRKAQTRSGAALADVGAAFFASGDLASLYAADGIHPSEAGAELAAKVLAETITRTVSEKLGTGPLHPVREA